MSSRGDKAEISYASNLEQFETRMAVQPAEYTLELNLMYSSCLCDYSYSDRPKPFLRRLSYCTEFSTIYQFLQALVVFFLVCFPIPLTVYLCEVMNINVF